MFINGSLSVSRGSDDKIRIRVRDEASNAEFLVAELTPHDFAMMITGLSGIEAKCEVRGLEVVGKKRIREQRTVIYPKKSYDRTQLEQWLEDNCQEDGWFLDSALRSQSSTFYSGTGTGLNYAVYRYEDAS